MIFVKYAMEHKNMRVTEQVAEGTLPGTFLDGLLHKELEWEIDYTKASPEESIEWRKMDLTYRIMRAFRDGRPVAFGGEIFNSLKDSEKLLIAIADPKGRAVLGSDDSNGVVIVVAV